MIQSPSSFPVPLVHIKETDSTNSYLQNNYSSHPAAELTTVLSDFQTAGRGQRGNSWESSPGANLLFSFVLYPSFLEARCQFRLSQIVSLSIKEVLAQYTDHITIKWPNDIYWKEKKIGGMLIENNLTDRYISQSIAGIGLNINQKEFYSTAPNPTSLRQITGNKHDRFDLLSQIMERLKEYYILLQEEQTSTISNRYHNALFRKEGMHVYRDTTGTFRAKLIGVEPTGALVLKDELENEKLYLFKEIQYIL